MSRSDYIEFAAALKRALEHCRTDEQRQGVKCAAEAIAHVWVRRTPMFDVNLFLHNAGVRKLLED